MKTIKHSFVLWAATLMLVACDYNNYPSGPVEYVYDTIDCSGWDIPAGAITVREALTIGKQIGKGGLTSDYYYVKGIVSSFHTNHKTAMEGNFHNGQFYIQDNTDVAASFYCYHTRNIDNTDFLNLEQLQIGDFVVVKCKITNFNGTIETDNASGSYLVFSTRDETYPARKVTYLTDPFSTGMGNWTTQVVSGSIGNIWAVTTGENPYILANSQGTACESWLVSPEFNVGTNHDQPVKLYFTHGFRSDAGRDQVRNCLRVKIRDNAGTWNDMEINKFGTGSILKVNLDSLDITSYANGNIQVAFAYKSNEVFQPQWKISDISVCGTKRGR